MIFTILSIVLLLVGIFVLILACNYYYDSEWLFCISIGSIVVGVVSVLLCTIILLDTHLDHGIHYENTLLEKQMIEYRLGQVDIRSVGGESLYREALEFNANLRLTKKWANNPWTNWFHNQDIASIDYIDIDLEGETS